MYANVRGTSTIFGDWKQIVSESHIFSHGKCPVEDILPCIHVLCSSCLETIPSRTGKKSGDKMVCKVCKLHFEIPSREVLRDCKATRELLSELSIAANDITQWCEICRNKYPITWNEMNGNSALVYCTVCRKNECKGCAKKWCSGHRLPPKRSHFKEQSTNFGNHERHQKQLEIYCIGCDKHHCFLCLLNNVSYSNKDDIDKALSTDIELKSLDALSKQLSAGKVQVEEQIRDFRSSVMSIKNKIETSYLDQVTALDNQKKLLLNQLRAIDTEVKEQLEKNRDIILELSKKADTFRKSCASIQSTGNAEEKFYTVGAADKKINDLKTELNHVMKLSLPLISYDSSDLNKYFEGNKIEVHWRGKTHKWFCPIGP